MFCSVRNLNVGSNITKHTDSENSHNFCFFAVFHIPIVLVLADKSNVLLYPILTCAPYKSLNCSKQTNLCNVCLVQILKTNFARSRIVYWTFYDVSYIMIKISFLCNIYCMYMLCRNFSNVFCNEIIIIFLFIFKITV